MDETILAENIDNRCTEFWVPFNALGDFKKQEFGRLLNKLIEYEQTTRDHNEIDRRVVNTLFLCYLAFQHYWDFTEKYHPANEEIRLAEREINEVGKRILNI